jgi:thioesterase domain-containing protein
MARELAVKRGLLPDDVDVPSYQRLFAVYDGNLEVLSRYRPGSTPVPTLLFVAAAVDRPDPVPAWRAVCAQLEVESAPFDHHSIVGAGQLARIARRVGAWSAPLRAGAHR